LDTFDSAYRQYLDKLEQIDLFDRASALNLQIRSGKIMIPFFGRWHHISKQGILGPDGCMPTPAVGTVLLDFLLRNKEIRPAAFDKISFRDIKGAGPLVGNFANNTNRLIAQTFAGRLVDLEAACRDIHGERVTDPVSSDLYMRIMALPEVPLYLSFNDQDEDFPAQCNLFFDRSAEQYLAMKSLFVLGTSLAGSLIKFQDT